MGNLNHFNSAHLQYLTPLLKWRVMDLQSLLKECPYQNNYLNFAKIIRSLESKKIIHGYRHPFNKKKYIYFSSYGQKLLGRDDNPTALNDESLLHDIKVSELGREFLAYSFVNNVELEHQLHNKGMFYSRSGLVPDAVVEVIKNKTRFRIALELELTQKSRPRIIEKAKQYLMSRSYDQVIYLFASEALMQSYREKIQSIYPDQKSSKILFFYNEDLTRSSNVIDGAKGMYKEKFVFLNDLLEGLNDN